MPPKRPPTSPKKRSQPTIASFFSPPKKRAAEVVEVADSSDDEVVLIDAVVAKKARVEGEERDNGVRGTAKAYENEVTEVVKRVHGAKAEETDEALARRLAAEWEAEDRTSASQDAEVKRELDAQVKHELDTQVKSGLEATPLKLSSPATSSSPKSKIHPMFARSQPEAGPSRLREVKSPTTPKEKEERKPTLTAARAQRVEPIDFDSDSLLFRPDAVGISQWPQSRLPYSVLVGVYVQVASTRSRLTIVRVLTK